MLIVLLFIVALSLLLMQSMSIVQKAFNGANKIRFMTQTNLMLNSLKGILDKFLSKVNSAEALYILKQLPFYFEDQKSGMKVEINFNSGASKFNINNILDKNETKRELYFELFDALLSKYNVADRRFFFEILLDTIDKDKEEREYGSEIALFDEEFKDGGIENFEKFEKILEYYENLRNDANIYRVPWERLIGFRGTQIDINSADKELIEAALKGSSNVSSYLEREAYITKLDNLWLSDEQKKRLEFFGFVIFAPVIECDINFMAFEESVKIKFLYDIKKKSINELEINY